MEVTWIAQIKEDWTCEYLVPQAEFYEALKGHMAAPTTTTMVIASQISTNTYNADRTELIDGQQQHKTSVNSSNYNNSNQLAKSNPRNNPN